MPKTKEEAKKRAKKLGFKSSSVVSADGDNKYYIAPRGVERHGAKKAYATCRMKGGGKEKCAKISWYVEKKKK